MKTKDILIIVILAVSVAGCKENAYVNPDILSNSFLPMQVGNYWKIDSENYEQITDTVRIEGDLFYKFYSVYSDTRAIQYLRIDSSNTLIEKIPTDPKFTFVHARFNSKIGDKFYTLGDGSINDFEVTLKFNNNDTIKFEFDIQGTKRIFAYKRGLGFVSNWKEIRIDNRTYRF